MKYSILILFLLTLCACGDNITYNIILEDCICSQQKKDVVIQCSDGDVFTIKNAKCERKINE